MLDETLTAQLADYLKNLVEPIQLRMATDDSARSTEMVALLQQIAGLSDKVTVEEAVSPDGRTPSFEIVRVSDPSSSVRFAGIPLGHEFTSLVLALLHVGGHPPKFDAELLDQVRALPGPFHFETYFSKSCMNCPDVVQALNVMAALNPNITHVAIDGADFQDEVEAHAIKSVPTVFLNGDFFDTGRMTLEQIVAKLDTGAAARQAEALNAKETFEVLVVGGGPAGAAAAIYTARKGINTGVVAERFGGQVMDTVGIENFISVSRTEGPKLAAALESHVREYDVDLMTNQSATAIEAQEDGTLALHLANGATLRTKTMILSTGARWRNMGVPGEQEYRNKGVTNCPHCDGPLFKGKRIAVVGGGNSGIEAAIDLAGVVGHVTVVEFLDELRADEVLQRKLHSLPNVDVILSARSTEVLGDGESVTGLEYEDRTSGELHRIDLEGVFVQIGLLPNTEWLKGTVELSERGEVVIDDRGQTSVPGVFAAGDCTTEPYKQIIIAMGGGATAALSAFDHLIRTSAPLDAVH
jgi:alkyl hydroperoxide reductase subunit F